MRPGRALAADVARAKTATNAYLIGLVGAAGPSVSTRHVRADLPECDLPLRF